MALIPKPNLRRNIKNIVSKNKSLKDILSPTAEALEVTSVEALNYQVYNTKTIVVVSDNGVVEERVLLYNRLNLTELLQNVTVTETTLSAVVDELNGKGFDFTEDDIDLVNGEVVAKPTSLGYYNGSAAAGNSDRALFLITDIVRPEDSSYEGFKIKATDTWVDYTTSSGYSFPDNTYQLALQGLYLEDDDTTVVNFWEWQHKSSLSDVGYRDGLFVYNISEEALVVDFEISSVTPPDLPTQTLADIATIPDAIWANVVGIDKIRPVVEDIHVKDVSYNTLNLPYKDQVTLAAPMYRRSTALVNAHGMFTTGDYWNIVFNATTQQIIGLNPEDEGFWGLGTKWMNAGVKIKINDGPVITATVPVLSAIAEYLSDNALWTDQDTGDVVTNAKRRVYIYDFMRYMFTLLTNSLNTLSGQSLFDTLYQDPYLELPLNRPTEPFCIWGDMNIFQSMDSSKSICIAGLGSKYHPNLAPMRAAGTLPAPDSIGDQYFYNTANHKVTIVLGSMSSPETINLFENDNFQNSNKTINVYSAFTLDTIFNSGNGGLSE